MEEMQAQMEKRRPGFDKIIDIKWNTINLA
jgi:hypothetical protein